MSMALAAVAPERSPEPAVAREPSRAAVTAASTGTRSFGRMLARCGAGGCTCGGACGGHHADDELLLEEGQKALARAVQARSS
jgi:hypothetical protein